MRYQKRILTILMILFLFASCQAKLPATAEEGEPAPTATTAEEIKRIPTLGVRVSHMPTIDLAHAMDDEDLLLLHALYRPLIPDEEALSRVRVEDGTFRVRVAPRYFYDGSVLDATNYLEAFRRIDSGEMKDALLFLDRTSDDFPIRVEGDELVFSVLPGFGPEVLLNPFFVAVEKGYDGELRPGRQAERAEVLECTEMHVVLIDNLVLQFELMPSEAETEEAFAAKDVDWMIPSRERIAEEMDKKNPNLSVLDDTELTFVRVHASDEALASIGVRRALAHSIHRKGLAEIYGIARPATALVLPGMKDAEGGEFRETGDYLWDAPENAEEGAELMNRTLTELAIDKSTLHWRFLVPDEPVARDVANALASMWEEIFDIHLVIEVEDADTYAFRLAAEDYELAYESRALRSPSVPLWLAGFLSGDLKAELLPTLFAKHSAQDEHAVEETMMAEMDVIPIAYTARSVLVHPYVLGHTVTRYAPAPLLDLTVLETQ